MKVGGEQEGSQGHGATICWEAACEVQNAMLFTMNLLTVFFLLQNDAFFAFPAQQQHLALTFLLIIALARCMVGT
jgi:hypothetical protein